MVSPSNTSYSDPALGSSWRIGPWLQGVVVVKENVPSLAVVVVESNPETTTRAWSSGRSNAREKAWPVIFVVFGVASASLPPPPSPPSVPPPPSEAST